MAEQFYENSGCDGFFRDRIIGNGLAPFIATGSQFERGIIDKSQFLKSLREWQDYFGQSLQEALGWDLSDGSKVTYEALEGLAALACSEKWDSHPDRLEQFLSEVYRLRGDEYSRPRWLELLLQSS